MESVRLAVSSQAEATQVHLACQACSAAAAQQAGPLIDQEAPASIGDDDVSALKSERIKELQRELAATLDERDALQVQLDCQQQYELPQ